MRDVEEKEAELASVAKCSDRELPFSGNHVQALSPPRMVIHSKMFRYSFMPLFMHFTPLGMRRCMCLVDTLQNTFPLLGEQCDSR